MRNLSHIPVRLQLYSLAKKPLTGRSLRITRYMRQRPRSETVSRRHMLPPIVYTPGE
jgi:hypothetical protein